MKETGRKKVRAVAIRGPSQEDDLAAVGGMTQAQPRPQQWEAGGQAHSTVEESPEDHVSERSPGLHPSVELGQLQEGHLEGTAGAAGGGTAVRVRCVPESSARLLEAQHEADCPRGAGVGPKKPHVHPAVAGLSCGCSRPSRGVWEGAVDHDHPHCSPSISQPLSYILPFLPHSPLDLQAQLVPRDAGPKQLSHQAGTALHGDSTLALPPAAVRRQGRACSALHGLGKGSPGADTLSGLSQA